MADFHDDVLSRYEEGIARISDIEDLEARQFVDLAVAALTRRVLEGEKPVTPIDLVFYVEVTLEIFAKRESLMRILRGEDLRWWTEDADDADNRSDRG